MEEADAPGLPVEFTRMGLEPHPPYGTRDDDDVAPQVVTDLRRRMWERGWRPIEVYNHDQTVGITGYPVSSPGKQPVGTGWAEEARQHPPAAATRTARIIALNTGMLCDGLRVIDIDVNCPNTSASLRLLVEQTLTPTPLVRRRDGSPRIAMVYRAQEGTPPKRVIENRQTQDKLEILGHGQQVVVDGIHPSGALLWWENGDTPWDFAQADVPAVSEAQIDGLLQHAGAVLGVLAPPDVLPVVPARDKLDPSRSRGRCDGAGSLRGRSSGS